MSASKKYGIIGAILGAVSSAVSASPLTVVDIVLGGAILGGIGFAIGKYKENKSTI
jgi:VIT1/CCC1 family predicted Fe2+/Mn2+ transporter